MIVLLIIPSLGVSDTRVMVVTLIAGPRAQEAREDILKLVEHGYWIFLEF
jgi:hypothetical protein